MVRRRRRIELSHMHFLHRARRRFFVGQVANVPPIGGALWARRAVCALCGSQSWLPPAFSRRAASARQAVPKSGSLCICTEDLCSPKKPPERRLQAGLPAPR